MQTSNLSLSYKQSESAYSEQISLSIPSLLRGRESRGAKKKKKKKKGRKTGIPYAAEVVGPGPNSEGEKLCALKECLFVSRRRSREKQEWCMFVVGRKVDLMLLCF
jgi:hypothetical protein